MKKIKVKIAGDKTGKLVDKDEFEPRESPVDKDEFEPRESLCKKKGKFKAASFEDFVKKSSGTK